MPGLMSRASTIVKAKMSKLLDRAEDPSETLDYSYERQLELLQNVKRGIADVATAKKRLELQTAQLEQSVVKLETQARDALAAALPGAQVTDPDETGVFEVTVDAPSHEEALQQVWDAIAAAGADDHVAFAEHPDLPEHWRHRARARP